MHLPEGLHLKSLTATSLGRRSTIVPVELLRRTKHVNLCTLDYGKVDTLYKVEEW